MLSFQDCPKDDGGSAILNYLVKMRGLAEQGLFFLLITFSDVFLLSARVSV